MTTPLKLSYYSYLFPAVHPGMSIPVDLYEKVGDLLKTPSAQIKARTLILEGIQVYDGSFYSDYLLDPENYRRACSILERGLYTLRDMEASDLKGLIVDLGKLIDGENKSGFRTGIETVCLNPRVPIPHLEPDKFLEWILHLPKDNPNKQLQAWGIRFVREECIGFLTELVEKKCNSPIEDSCILSEESKKNLKKFVYIAPHAALVDSQMEDFCENLIGKLRRNDEDPFAIAAFVHQEMVRIHPFQNGNGRTARLLMNGILTLFGHPPVYFWSKKEYDTEVGRSLTSYKSFALYLKDKVLRFTVLKGWVEKTGKVFHETMVSLGFMTCKWEWTPAAEKILKQAQKSA